MSNGPQTEPARSLKWILGLDRAGPVVEATKPGEPLRPFTVPNIVTYCRLVLVPVFLVLALSSHDGRYLPATVVFSVAAASDFLDGLLARALDRHSRLGVLLDPLIDRLLVVAAMVVVWRFELLPRWAIAIVVVRELIMLVASRYGLKRGMDIEVRWYGRLGLWLILSGVWLALIWRTAVAEVLFLAGTALTVIAAALYLRRGYLEIASRPAAR